MKLKWFINTTALALIIVAALIGLAGHDSIVAAQEESSKIESLLLDKFATDSSADFIVRFIEQADLSLAKSMDWEARGEFVYNTLRDTAANSQVNATAILNSAGLKYQTFIGGNDLYVWSGTLLDADALAALPEVASIRATRTYSIDPVEVIKPLQNITWAGDYLLNNAVSTVGNSIDATIDWGITDSKADQFWTAYGVQGTGIKVANIDTGVQWNHPALVNQFACPGDPTNADCWNDPENWCGGSACDNNGHGTHTMGTMVAADDPGLTYIAGMAPDSTWIACKGCGMSSCSDFALQSCFDWILAPGGDTANRPDVVNNSWGGGQGDSMYEPYITAAENAGIFVAFSIGNSGPSCGTANSPGDLQVAFASGAHDSSRNIASFSSRGPGLFGHEPYVKPNISAPGVSICSTVPTNGWSCGYSGTSMASPHTAGAVALLWSCNPSLVGQIDATFQILQSNADTPPAGSCGAPPDGQGNYTFGYGYLDVLQAGIFACGELDFGSIDGHVLDQSANPVAGASVSAFPGTEGNAIHAITDPSGYYTMTLPVGTYNLTASKLNYTSQTVNGVLVEVGEVTTQNFQLTFLGGWTQIPRDVTCPDYTRLDGEYYNGLVYFLGGRGGGDGGSTFGDVIAYNPVTDTCADTGANMPTPVSNYTISLVNNGAADLLCIFGGRPSAGGVTSAVQCYNPVANTASQVTTLPGALSSFTPAANVVLNGKVLVFGGFQNISPPYETNVTYEWNPVTNSWTQKGNLPLALGYIQAAVVDGKVYGFGGTIFDGASLNAQIKTEVYDPALGTWNDASVAELPTSCAEGRTFGFDTSSAYELAGKIIIAGGGQWPAETNEAFSYDVTANTYDYTFPNLNVPRRDQAGFFVPGNPGALWVFGGRTGGIDTPPYANPEYYSVDVATLAPSIVVTPATLEASLLPDAMTTLTLTIGNEGNLPLDWSLTEVPAAPKVGESSGVPQRLSHIGIQPPAKPNTKPLVDMIADGSFEAGSPNPEWTEYSSNFGSPLCTIAGCGTGTGTGPRTGDWWAWFGGINTYEEGYVYQDVTITPGHPTLSFWLENYVCDSADDYLEVLVDGTQVFLTDGANPACGVLGYALKTVDLSAFADGEVHEIRFHSEIFATNGIGTNFFVDDIALDDPVTWLSEMPTSGTVQPGEFVEVAVTFDSADLTVDEYLASLEIASNDLNEPVVNVPVSLTVLPQADLGITKTDSPDPVRVGVDLTYTLLVTNDGPQAATGVKVVDTLPDGVTFVSATTGCVENAGVVTCNIGALAMGDVFEITIVVTPEVEGTITNEAKVSGNEDDPNAANDQATQDTLVTPAMFDINLPLVLKG